jgi:STE24 endopeptidase
MGAFLALMAKQACTVARHRGAVPAGFANEVSLAEHQTAADYEHARLGLRAGGSVVGLVVALAWAWAGYDLMFGAVAGQVAPGLTRGVLFVVAVEAVSTVIGLPMALIGTFGVERRFGFNRTTPGRFVADRLKGAALGLILGVPLLYGLLWLMRVQGAWWFWVWAGLVVLMFVMMEAFPRFIAPLFNNFSPLEGELRTRIEGLLQRCGFEAAGLFVMDASKRSAHGNAYFTGLGRSKRIVLFDTLIAKNSEAELEAVLAHELGHFKLNHIWSGMARSVAILFAGCFALGVLSHQPWLLPEFGITHRDDALSLVVCLVLLQMVNPILSIGANWISRKHEYQADDFARRMVGADPMASALVRLSRDNASTLTPDPLYALVNYSHPPVPLRVARLRLSEKGTVLSA